MDEPDALNEERSLTKRLGEGESPPCPRCGALLRITPIPPRTDIPYVRKRVLLTCPSCPYRVALDRP